MPKSNLRTEESARILQAIKDNTLNEDETWEILKKTLLNQDERLIPDLTEYIRASCKTPIMLNNFLFYTKILAIL